MQFKKPQLVGYAFLNPEPTSVLRTSVVSMKVDSQNMHGKIWSNPDKTAGYHFKFTPPKSHQAKPSADILASLPQTIPTITMMDRSGPQTVTTADRSDKPKPTNWTFSALSHHFLPQTCVKTKLPLVYNEVGNQKKSGARQTVCQV